MTRNLYAARCWKCGKRVAPLQGRLTERGGVQHLDGECKPEDVAAERQANDELLKKFMPTTWAALHKVEAPANGRQGLGDGATMSTVAPSIAERGEKSNGY